MQQRTNEYKRWIDAFIITRKPAANKDAMNLYGYTKLGAVRMNRIDKTTRIIPALKESLWSKNFL